MVVEAEFMTSCPKCNNEVEHICVNKGNDKAGKTFTCRNCGQKWRINKDRNAIEPKGGVAIWQEQPN